MKKVLTMSDAGFEAACARLENRVEEDGMPDVVVGIESGGRFVAARMFCGAVHCYVALRRESTERRPSVVSALLGYLPRVVCDMLRRLEDKMAARRIRRGKPYEGRLPAELGTARSILVVDDAVDTGATMLAVRDAIADAYPEARIRTAAVVATLENALVKPDFVLYENCLIRFPWSADMKK